MNISVCMATYNGAKYIKEQIDSILVQLRECDELIISDDNSPDNTRHIVESYNDTRIKFIMNTCSKGVAHNFENAIRYASGDIIFLADQDDVWFPDKISRMSTFMIDNNLNVVCCNCAVTDSKLNVIREEYYTNESPVDRSAFGNFVKDLWLGCCMAFSRSVVDVVLPFPPKLIAHDLWIALYGQLHFKCGYYPQVLQYYRRHGNNVSFADGKSSNTLYFKLKYRIYIAYHILLRSIKTNKKEEYNQ